MRNILFVLAALAMLVGLFLWLRPAPAPLQAVEGAPGTSPAPPAPEQAHPVGFDLVVKDGKLVSGPATLAVAQGDAVRLRVQSDRDDELHLHGYDLELPLKAHDTGQLDFTADRSGRFDIELHHAGTGIGALEVEPR